MEKNIDKKIFDIDTNICKNINKFDNSERGLLSQNILSQLRNLIELIFLRIYNRDNNQALEPEYSNFRIAEKYIKRRGKYRFLGKFHELLQISTSHYTLDENASERLMLKYFEYLFRIKLFLKKEFDLNVLMNIEKFPINLDKTTKIYYEKIVKKLNNFSKKNLKKDRYYIQKIKPFFIDNNIYYEVTFTKAHERVSKFDRIIAFTRHEIICNYAVDLYIRKDYIEILGEKMPINIIDNWQVSIRPCEINNFAKVFNDSINISSSHREYKELMRFLTYTKFSLVDLVLEDKKYFEKVKNRVIDKYENQFFKILDKCREIILNNEKGSIILRYLLYTMNNNIIKLQLYNKPNPELSNLFLKWESIPFDQMPFTTSLFGHNPKIFDLLECIDLNEREHEFLARKIKNNTEIERQLFTSIDEIKYFENFKSLIKKYNSRIYTKTQSNRLINLYKDKFLYLKGYVDDTVEIIEKLVELSKEGIENYSNSVRSWIRENNYEIDCDSKKDFLIRMFENSRVAIIYGAAGTGKSTMINHISHFFKDYKKIYLAQTNPAIDNLKRKVDTINCDFMTISKFLSKNNENTECAILFIDECSTVSNKDMITILKRASFSLLVLVGDVFQIESIRFGNWFEILKYFINKKAIFELTKPWRAKNEKLLKLWKQVRNRDDDLLEYIEKYDYSANLDESIFENFSEDEIILCLNYDGLYGINNINRFLQAHNPNKAFEWGDLIYKVGDPILFNETYRFGNVIYNNLKGKIVNINLLDKQIEFDIEIKKVLNELDVQFYDFELISSNEDSSVIRFRVKEFPTTDIDYEYSDAVVPFQVAYAVSIHKAQGLEYNSVKVVITDEIEEQITHNIFYTAITRAKEKLKIYWSAETENKVIRFILENSKINNIKRDVGLLKAKFKEERK